MSIPAPTHVTLIRAPFSYRYHVLDVHEEPIITYLLGYFRAIDFSAFNVVDFHLQREVTLNDIVSSSASDYVIAVRETIENVHYALRIAKSLSVMTKGRIWLYGQTARLQHLPNLPGNIRVVPHVERLLASSLGLSADGPRFEDDLASEPYFHTLNLSSWQTSRFKAGLESTRGCHYPCTFCFINTGNNYGAKWQTRPTQAILRDVSNYSSRGIRNIVFYDSEFLGADVRTHEIKRELLIGLSMHRPSLKYKIYSRADTLLRFNEFELLQRSGLSQVFMGVESFSQQDLDALKKQISVDTIIRCIEKLRDMKIHINLSFITFNRATTCESIAENLRVLRLLLSKNSQFLGMPNFVFSFETDWQRVRPTRPNSTLSRHTYVWLDLDQKAQPQQNPCFDTGLEPLMEIYRLLAYEWSKKVTQLNLQRHGLSVLDAQRVDMWFEGLSRFCVETMIEFLEDFRQSKLTISGLSVSRDKLFGVISSYYLILPKQLRSPATFSQHGGQIDYSGIVEQLEPDEYWSDHIPAVS